MSDDVLDRITELVEPSLRQLGVELYQAEWDSQGRDPVLRLLIDRAGGVSLDDCERVSNAVSAVLDAYDPIEAGYLLEVSSPGAERPLRHLDDWQQALGMRVNVRYAVNDAEAVVEGRLLAVAGDDVEVEVRDGRVQRPLRIALADVRAARRAVEF